MMEKVIRPMCNVLVWRIKMRLIARIQTRDMYRDDDY